MNKQFYTFTALLLDVLDTDLLLGFLASDFLLDGFPFIPPTAFAFPFTRTTKKITMKMMRITTTTRITINEIETQNPEIPCHSPSVSPRRQALF